MNKVCLSGQGYFSELPDVHNQDIGIFDPNALISDDQQDFFSVLPDVHNLDIEMFDQYALISDEY